jgi:hypothetical protein
MTGVSQEELQAATAATLRAYPTSNEAQALVRELASLVAEHELQSGARQKSRKGTKDSFDYAVGAFIADLLKPLGSEPRHEWVYRSMHAKSFTGKQVTHRTFKRLVEQLVALSFVDRVEGYRVSDDSSDTGRYAARFRATPKLLQLCERHGVAPTQAVDHFKYEYDLPAEPLQLRSGKQKNFYRDTEITGKPMDFERTFITNMMETDLRELNEFFAKQVLRGGSHEGYVRIFNNGDDPAFDWNMGGRLYSQFYSESYQVRSSAERAEMIINDEPVAEIDIGASYLTIFLAWHGQQLQITEDPYLLDGFGQEKRSAVKAWMAATFGNTKPARRWPPRMLKNQPELREHRASEVGKAALKKYPAIAKWGVEPRRGHIPTWANLMFEESMIMLQTMLRLMRENKVPSLAVHDSLIVQSSKAELAAQQLTKWFEVRTHTKPRLIINRKGYPPYRWLPQKDGMSLSLLK